MWIYGMDGELKKIATQAQKINLDNKTRFG
jgi:hypothetical protein